MDSFDRLLDVVARLRGDGGCDWDRAQTPASMRPYVLEEAFEAVEAIDGAPPGAVRKELGDLLFLVLMVSRMYEEAGAFSARDVADAAADKMIRRHPHVFGDATERPAWETMKAAERGTDGRPASLLDGLARAMPGLLRAARVSERAASVGFDWPDLSGVRAKVDEELGELDEAIALGQPAAVADELGDVLFSVVNLGRFLGINAEDAMRAATAKFERRFRVMETLLLDDGLAVSTTDPVTLDRYWSRAKESVG